MLPSRPCLAALLLLIGCSPAPRTGFEIGDLAPDIEGEDLEGVPFRLSDYRGKVVVLAFWGHW